MTPAVLAYDCAMVFLVDGYNVTKGDPATQDLTLEAQREALVSRLRARGEQMLGRGRIVVVFDGDPSLAQPGAAESMASYPIEVVFSRGGSADDEIVKRGMRASGEQVCLVSSDNGLAGRMRDHLGKRLDVRSREAAYESAQGRDSSRKRAAGTAREDGLPRNAASITEELKRTWLTDEE